jgi:hypothetical protein
MRLSPVTCSDRLNQVDWNDCGGWEDSRITHPKHDDKAHDELSSKPLPERMFEEAVAAVMHAPSLSEQRVKKEAAKKGRTEYKRKKDASPPPQGAERA